MYSLSFASQKPVAEKIVKDIFRKYQGRQGCRLRDRATATGADEFVFTDPDGNPLSQEWLHKRIWKPTLKSAGLRVRGQYNIRDTFITIALSAGEDPGWVAKVCGTSEQMIFAHYRTWIPGLQSDAGHKVGRVLGE